MRVTWNRLPIPAGARPAGPLDLARRVVSRLLLWLAVGVALFWLVVRAWMGVVTHDAIYTDPAAVPPAPVALVLGAGVNGDGNLSSAADNRVIAAAELYRLGKVKKLLISADNSSIWYDEVTPMRRRAIELGVPEADVAADYAGFRTYDSCYRARAIFGVERAIIVSQIFHLPRAVYICEQLGVDADALAAADFRWPWLLRSWLREEPAKLNAWLEVHLFRPLPTFLGPREEL